MIDILWATIGAVVVSALWCWAGYRWGAREERLWWTTAADSDYHMRDLGNRHYTVMHTQYFVDRYHNPLARYRQGKKPLYDVNVRGTFPQ